MRPQVLDHGRVVPGPLVAQLTLKGLLTCGRRAEGEAVRAFTGTLWALSPPVGLLETVPPVWHFPQWQIPSPNRVATSHIWQLSTLNYS